MDEIPISNLMTKCVYQITPRTYLKKVVSTMHDNKQSCLVVCKRGVPTGIITRSDLVKVLAENMLGNGYINIRADSIMSSPPVVFSSAMPAFEVLFLAQTHKITHLPIVDDSNKLCGIVTPTELLKNSYRLIESQYELMNFIRAKNSNGTARGKPEFTDTYNEDRLLDIANKQLMQLDLQFTHELSLRYDRAYSIILLELDYFELYCERYGYNQGIQVLKRIVGELKQSVRGSDRLYRCQNATLLVLLPETDLDSADLLAGGLVNAIANLSLIHDKSPLGEVTASAGVASEEPLKFKDITWQQLMERADNALLTAKETGHNKLAVSEGNNIIYTDIANFS